MWNHNDQAENRIEMRSDRQDSNILTLGVAEHLNSLIGRNAVNINIKHIVAVHSWSFNPEKKEIKFTARRIAKKTKKYNGDA